MSGGSYDALGNLLGDGTTTYAYDALRRVASTTRAGTTTTNGYNGDSTLVRQVTGATTTRYTQDLAAPLRQVLQVVGGSTTTYLYGHERLAINSSPRVWYLGDGLGSVRRTINESAALLATTSYDPWGTPQSALSTPFGFTGELRTLPGSRTCGRAGMRRAPGSSQHATRLGGGRSSRIVSIRISTVTPTLLSTQIPQ